MNSMNKRLFWARALDQALEASRMTLLGTTTKQLSQMEVVQIADQTFADVPTENLDKIASPLGRLAFFSRLIREDMEKCSNIQLTPEAAVAAAVWIAPLSKKTKAAKKRGVKKKKAAQAAAAKGRRDVARGDRPPIRKAIVRVMGDKVMDSATIVEELDKRGWGPNAKDPRTYVLYTLSENRHDVFERVSRGRYRVRAGVTVGNKPAALPKTKPRPFGFLGQDGSRANLLDAIAKVFSNGVRQELDAEGISKQLVAQGYQYNPKAPRSSLRRAVSDGLRRNHTRIGLERIEKGGRVFFASKLKAGLVSLGVPERIPENPFPN